ncbi:MULTISPECIES: helix-turn-helix domain-containing protein [unclassified Streptomyces]|uniref:PucR family transcriptional regulator n=1 Tax=unclassified Streptomyces TaxID=2593676 RepID=UPI002E191391|nr:MULTISPECIES: helix-turn-helix domain-containing protein [unclassified Streptomyces]
MTGTARSGARSGSPDGVSLSAMLAHPTWHDVTLLAGPGDTRGLQHPVAAQDLTHPLHEEPVGRLLVLLGGADRGDWRLDALLRRAHGAGVAALLVPEVTALRMSSTLLAERLRLPVLGSPDPLAAYLALERMTAEPGLLRAESALRTAQVCARADETVDALLTDLGALLHRPVALLTADARHLAGDPATVTPAEQDTVARQLAGPPLPRPLDLPGGARLLTHPVGTERVPPRLVVRLPARLAPEADAVAAALEVASGAVRERLALRRLDLERSARHRTSLLGELLRPAGGEIPDAVRRHAVEFGWRLDGWHTGIRIGTGPDVDVAGLRTEVTDAFAAERLGAQVVEQGDGWSAWASTDQEPSTRDIERHAAAVRRVQRRLPEVLHAYVGVGRAHPGPTGIARSLGEAADAARLAQGREASGRFFHVDRLGLAQLLLAWTRTDTFQPAARSLLEPLSGEPGDLVHTLTAYLDAESSTAETAAVLGVHRNTVAARIARVQQLLSVDLADPDERLALHLACRTAMDG